MSVEQLMTFQNFLNELKKQNKVEIDALIGVNGGAIYIRYNKKKYFDTVENVYTVIDNEIINKGYNTNCEFFIFMISDWKKIDKIKKV